MNMGPNTVPLGPRGRFDSLPDDLREWIVRTPRETLLARLKSWAQIRVIHADLDAEVGALTRQIAAADERYFALYKTDKKEEALNWFRLARTLSCLQYLEAGNEEEALYEFAQALPDTKPETAAIELGGCPLVTYPEILRFYEVTFTDVALQQALLPAKDLREFKSAILAEAKKRGFDFTGTQLDETFDNIGHRPVIAAVERVNPWIAKVISMGWVPKGYSLI